MIRVTDLEVRFGDVTALALPSLAIAAGERLAIEGPNGCGKTTLLRVLAGLLAPTSGAVSGVPRGGRVVLLHQRPYLFRGTARDNVAYALRLRAADPAGADAWLERVGAAHLADRPARELSGGEAARVALARALAAAPEVLLLDEPLASVDPAGVEAIRGALEAFEGTLVIAAPTSGGLPVDRAVRLE